MNASQPTMRVRISKATEVVWEGDAFSVSAKNEDGAFDILPMHANFITFLQKEPIVIRTKTGETKIFNFSVSVLYVHDSSVAIYTGIDE